jgi:hypothetical protein
MRAVGVGRKRTRCLITVVGLLSALAFPSFAAGHILHNGGTWTYRYLTREHIEDCGGGTGGSDPFNVLYYQYGEGNRINGHIESETHWGFYPGWVLRSHDYICGDSDTALGNYRINDSLDFDDQEGHGSYHDTVRAHFRIWYAPHGHGALVDKWSTIDVHHEKVILSVHIHQIDEDWETWEYHISSEMAGAHNFYYDYWARQGSQYIKGFFDDGGITRVGGLHNGGY